MYQRDESQKDNMRWQACPKCRHSTNDPGSIICEECGYSFLPSKTDKQKVRNLKVVKKGSAKKVKRTVRQKIYLFVVGGITVLASSVLIASNLNATSPEAALKKARGTISFGGEPCSQQLMQDEIAEQIEKLNKEVSFRYTDNDKERDQIDELISGQIQIAFSEKAYLNAHLERARERGVEITAIPYAYDGIAYITNKKTKVRPLTISELKAIFEGRITNWQELGGEEQKIIPVLMEGKHVNPMGIKLSHLSPNLKLIEDSRISAKEFVENNEGAIFYTSATLAVNQLNKFNVISIKKKDGTIVSPVLGKGQTNQADIASGKYPLVRQVLIMVNSEVFQKNNNNYYKPQQKGVSALAEYLISPQGQAIVQQAGFVPKYAVAQDTDNRFSFLPWF